MFSVALNLFRLDNGRYPTTEEGLKALFSNSMNFSTWDGPYLDKKNFKYINYFTYLNDSHQEYELIEK